MSVMTPDVARETVRVDNVEVARIGRFAVRVSWLAPYLGVWTPNWTDEEEQSADELPATHCETLEGAFSVADRPEWVLRLAFVRRVGDGFEFAYVPVEVAHV
jgi:hypothetical protein